MELGSLKNNFVLVMKQRELFACYRVIYLILLFFNYFYTEGNTIKCIYLKKLHTMCPEYSRDKIIN